VVIVRRAFQRQTRHDQHCFFSGNRDIGAADPMTLCSMTGYARSEGAQDGVSWYWEARSVNSKGQDIRCRVPPGQDALDAAARDAAGKAFKRGSISLSLQVDRGERKTELKINDAALDQILALQQSLSDRVDASPPRLDVLLSVRGIAETTELPEDEETVARRDRAMRDSLADTLARLAEARVAEGGRLMTVLQAQLADVARLTAAAAGVAETQPAQLRARLEQQVADLLEAKIGVSEERLAQEAALLAGKADVREEIDRLNSHIEAARALLEDGGVVGRKLDFLCQEFNREANTLCSKATDIALTRIGLDLKAVIEQFREQVQNVE